MNTINQIIEKVFADMPYQDYLNFLHNRQKTIVAVDIATKYKNERFSPADVEVQNIIVQYFLDSELFQFCNIRGEELTGIVVLFESTKEYIIFIDPIDGGPAYVAGGSEWGIMMGVCDRNGENIYSWFCSSDGLVTESKNIQSIESKSFAEQVDRDNNISIDIFSYSENDLVENAKNEILKLVDDNVRSCLEFSSWPAALYAAQELVRGNSAGILWLPSITGKGCYPDYDCVFFDAVLRAGYNIKIARRSEVEPESEGLVTMIAIAQNPDDLELLWTAGKLALGERFNNTWEVTSDKLVIT